MPDETLDRRLVETSVRKAFFFVGMALLLIGAAVGVALTDSMGMFYNFILMPGVGMLGYWLFRGKSFFVPLGIFLLSYLYQIPGTGFVAPLFMSVLYTLFRGLGLGIGFLLDYAFAKEGTEMKKKKLWIRILAAVLAFGLLWIVAWMTLSFTGDPISAAMSQRAAKDYIQQSNLRTMGFELSRASYNFKFGEYLVHAVSPHNPDLHFDIICRNGKVDYDTYQYDVLENGNVISRFQEEYMALLQIQMEQAGLGRLNLFVGTNEPSDSAVWVPGMTFDQDLPVEKTIHLYPDLEAMTLEAAAEYLQRVGAFFKEKGHDFARIDLYDTDEEKHTVMLTDIPVERIAKPDFLDYLKQQQREIGKRDEMEQSADQEGTPAIPTKQEDSQPFPSVYID